MKENIIKTKSFDFAIQIVELYQYLTISLKEANESDYWIELMFRSNYLDLNEYNSLKSILEQILKLLISIIKLLGIAKKQMKNSMKLQFR